MTMIINKIDLLQYLYIIVLISADECQAGEYSPTGYQPCLKCATGTYSDHTKAEICIACLPGKKTLKSGSTSSHDCKGMCMFIFLLIKIYLAIITKLVYTHI